MVQWQNKNSTLLIFRCFVLVGKSALRQLNLSQNRIFPIFKCLKSDALHNKTDIIALNNKVHV